MSSPFSVYRLGSRSTLFLRSIVWGKVGKQSAMPLLGTGGCCAVGVGVVVILVVDDGIIRVVVDGGDRG